MPVGRRSVIFVAHVFHFEDLFSASAFTYRSRDAQQKASDPSQIEIQRELNLPRLSPYQRLQEAGLRQRARAEDRIEPGDIRGFEKVEGLGDEGEAPVLPTGKHFRTRKSVFS